MAFFLQISIYWILLWIISKIAFRKQLQSHALKGRIAFSMGFALIGLIHIVNPASLAYMIEGLIPRPKLIIVITGVMEIIFAILLHFKKWRRTTGWAIIIYLVAIFPANINVAVQQLNAPGGLPSTPWYLWSRLLFQPLYIFWVYLCAIKTEKQGATLPDKKSHENLF